MAVVEGHFPPVAGIQTDHELTSLLIYTVCHWVTQYLHFEHQLVALRWLISLPSNFWKLIKYFTSKQSDHIIFFLFIYQYIKYSRFSKDFPKISDHLHVMKIFQNLSKCLTRHFVKISWRLPKMTEDCRKPPKKIQRCFHHTITNLSLVKAAKNFFYQKYIFTCEDMIMIFYQFVTTWYTTNFYILILPCTVLCWRWQTRWRLPLGCYRRQNNSIKYCIVFWKS